MPVLSQKPQFGVRPAASTSESPLECGSSARKSGTHAQLAAAVLPSFPSDDGAGIVGPDTTVSSSSAYFDGLVRVQIGFMSPVHHEHTALCNHAIMPKGAVWKAAQAGMVTELMERLCSGGSTEETDKVWPPLA